MKKYFYPLFGFLFIFVIWQGLAIIIGKPIIIPTVASTFHVFFRFLTSNELLLVVGQTSAKVFLVLILSVLIGLPAGLVLGRSTFLYGIFRPCIMVIQAVPVISWLTLVIFTWGIGWKGPVFISTFSLLPMSILTTISGVRNLDKDLLEMANLYQVPRKRILKQIYLGSLLPFIMSILKVNIGQAWKIVLVTEYLCSGNGLGEKIMMARMNLDTSSVWAYTLLAVLLGTITEFIVKLILKKALIYGNLS